MTQGQKLLQIATEYNHVSDLLLHAYNISSSEVFDAVVIAPTWTPYRIAGFPDECIQRCKQDQIGDTTKTERVPMMKKLSESFIVEWKNLRFAWIKTGTCAGNVIDSMLFLSNIKTDRLIFVGAAGGVVPNVPMGEMVIPRYCIDCVGATSYFTNNMSTLGIDTIVEPNNPDYINRVIMLANQLGIFPSLRKVFCTDTIIGEYYQMDRIQALGSEVIEMETSAFYTAASLMEKSAVAFLIISDNAVLGESLSAPRRERLKYYNQVIQDSIPQLIYAACKAEL